MTANEANIPGEAGEVQVERPWSGDELPLRSPGDALVEALVELAAHEPQLVVLTADLAIANRLLPFAEAQPERFRNLGTATRNALGVAAGMAATGKIPFVVLDGPAVAARAADLIATSIAGSGLHVVVVALPSGIEAHGQGGPAAGADLAALLALPGLLRIVAPADAPETAAAARALAATPGPAYLRLLGGVRPVLGAAPALFEIGPAHVLREGKALTIVATGALVFEALKAHAMLDAEGIQARVLAVPTLKPLDEPAIRRAARETGGLVVAEEHALRGGLGAAIAQDLARSHPAPIEFVAIEDRAFSGVDPGGLRAALGLGAQAIAEAARRLKGRIR